MIYFINYVKIYFPLKHQNDVVLMFENIFWSSNRHRKYIRKYIFEYQIDVILMLEWEIYIHVINKINHNIHIGFEPLTSEFVVRKYRTRSYLQLAVKSQAICILEDQTIFTTRSKYHPMIYN